MEWLADPNAWIALVTLTALEIVLGIDNIIFLTVLVGRLPESQRNLARTLGLALAMGTRILLLLSLAWIMSLTAPLFEVPGVPSIKVPRLDISGRDLILLGGGLFLLWKASTRSTIPSRARGTAKAARPAAPASRASSSRSRSSTSCSRSIR